MVWAMRTDGSKTRVLILYLILFFAAWTASELLLVPRLAGLSRPVLILVREVGLKGLIWLLPALLLIRRYDSFLALPRRELFRPPKSWSLCIEILVILAVCLVLGSLLRSHSLSISPDFIPADLIWIALVGLMEETVFRGWLLNLLLEPGDLEGEKLPWKPIAFSSVLFLLIHFPLWYRTGALVANLAGGAFVSILFLSVLFSWTFLRTRSLLVPIVIHSFWDLLVTVIAI